MHLHYVWRQSNTEDARWWVELISVELRGSGIRFSQSEGKHLAEMRCSSISELIIMESQLREGEVDHQRIVEMRCSGINDQTHVEINPGQSRIEFQSVAEWNVPTSIISRSLNQRMERVEFTLSASASCTFATKLIKTYIVYILAIPLAPKTLFEIKLSGKIRLWD